MAAAVHGDAGTNRGKLRGAFLATWGLLLLAKLLLAWRLPVFVDEAFYAWEAGHPAWAYSDLPGGSAALARLGLALAPGSAFALRLPFLLLGAALPWLMVRIARRWFGEEAGWRAGLLALLMPLSGMLGVMALPDVPLVLAALLSVDAIAALRERVAAPALLELALALVLGAFAHYRFAAVLLAGAAGLLLDPRGRALLREPRLWAVLALGAAAWWPLLHWNLENATAGLRFQLLERNPWSFHGDGIAWLGVQALLVTPPLCVLLLATLWRAWRRRKAAEAPWGLVAGIGTVAVAGWFVLGFFADSERVSFHWPLAGWLLLAAAAPALLAHWSRRARALLWSCAALGLGLAFAFLVAASSARARQALADTAFYPNDFAGWPQALPWFAARVPRAEALVASDFELAAQLAFALQRRDVGVLDSPLNRKHGRAAQLRLWGRAVDSAPATPAWIAVDDSATPLRDRLAAYHRRCETLGVLPPPQWLSVDHGRKRYLLYRYDPAQARVGCVAPALAWLDAPARDATVPRRFDAQGWAFKDGVGLARVQVLLDGKVVADADYGRPMPNVAAYWRLSTDPAHPRVGFRASVDARALPPGRHWLGLRLHGRDGGVEDWPEQPLRLE
jgi:4-amino-4-deoxy-L-arabinose transferase-like glycosyltransferase